MKKEKKLKQILIGIRNGGFITPAIAEIMELFAPKGDWEKEFDKKFNIGNLNQGIIFEDDKGISRAISLSAVKQFIKDNFVPKQNDDWEKEFDELFGYEIKEVQKKFPNYLSHNPDIKQFIKGLLQ